MTRSAIEILFLGTVGALAACGGSTQPVAPAAPSVAPAEPAVAETPAPAAAEAPAPAAPTAPEPTYLPGKWVWFELNTTDVDRAKEFYGPLLGWQLASRDLGGQTYNSISAGGKEIGLINPPPPDRKKVTPHWMGYVSVPDVDAAVATATEKGGAVSMPAMDMPQVGRFAVMSDPVGAAFGVVKSARGDDPDTMPGPGQFMWIEHWSKDAKKVAAAAAFYAAVAGYRNETLKMGKTDYTMASASGGPRMGFSRAAKASTGDRFVPYVVVPNVDDVVKAATKAKGKVVTKATDIPDVGRVAVIADPQGALMGLITPATSGEAEQAAPGKPPGAKPVD